MRQKLEFPHYDEHEALTEAGDVSAEVGRAALNTEQIILEDQYGHEKAIQDAEFLDAYGSRNRFLTRAPGKKEVLGWVEGKFGPLYTIESGTVKAHNTIKNAESTVRTDTLSLHHQIVGLRKTIERLDDYTAAQLGQGIESTLDEYAARHNLDPNKLAFRQWKRKAEDEAGEPMTWAEWIMRPGEQPKGSELDTRDRQVLNLLHMNQTVFEERNKDPEVRKRIEALDSTYANGLKNAVQLGALSPRLLDKYKARTPRVIIGEPLDEVLLQANGYINPNKDIVLRPGFKDGTYSHERSHLLGGFDGIFLNEGGAQYIANLVDLYGGSQLHDSPAYKPNWLSIHEFMDAGSMDTRQMSEYFALKDTDGFFAAISRAAGEDVFGGYLDARVKAKAQYSDFELQQEQIKHNVYDYAEDLARRMASRRQP